ncbi:type I-G CRISPR-associated helicase/endonuclease Cas3g [Oceanibacterium hippocampi]|uniref:DEAD/DEAH box helicase n=1 Tax=Oceanibacterium hippocampi TaxID=745714 RepID=A0A1Y5TZZ4_9PROT|nr:type I-U CRISPR-associated helicase/endonuclease Cas3 [Oceanibacterium hippocampi]SLN77780.1 DEAD/DEAH box helicase [Oceanibacterium hippocampi]
MNAAGETAAFAEKFEALTSYAPFAWQVRLYRDHFLNGDIPAGLDIATGLGKTKVMTLWYLALKAGAQLPRRLVYVVDRRAVVDQATTEAQQLKRHSGDDGLRISTLRGQYADNRRWHESPAEPAIIIGTVDMIGSRLLFSGYGVSRRMRPYQAGLLGADTLVVLDEAHLVPPFERLLRQIEEGEGLRARVPADRSIAPPFRLLPLSATGREQSTSMFRLADSDRTDDAAVAQRLNATKRLSCSPRGEQKLEECLAEQAWRISTTAGKPVRVLVYCNGRDIAGKVRTAIEKRAKSEKCKASTELFVGARRVHEREAARKELEELGFFSGDNAPAVPAFVIATSAGEVGVDLDADHMVMDLVPFERVVQRLGRVNRLGSKDAQVIVIGEDEPKPKKPETPTPDEQRASIAWRALKLLEQLPERPDGTRDASPAALAETRDRAGPAQIAAASTPAPLHPALTRPLVDAWSMTSLTEHTGQPEVQPWLRGWIEELPQCALVWRKYLPVRPTGDVPSDREVAEFFAAAPPHLTERLENRVDVVRDWLVDRTKIFLRRSAPVPDATGDSHVDGSQTAPGADSVVLFVLGHAGEVIETYSPRQLARFGASAGSKKKLARAITNSTLVLDAQLGGLGEAGLFDANVTAPASTPDTDPEWEKTTGFRIRTATPDSTSDDPDWLEAHRFDTLRSAEDEPLRQLRVDIYRDRKTDEDQRSLTPGRAQTLAEHQDWTARKAEVLAAGLGLPPEIADAIVLAAVLHDEGKRAEIWQRAFNAKRDDIYAKTRGPLRLPLLGGYRHEFGSIAHVERDARFRALDPGLRDLVLHLVAAHHGRARPLIETDGADGPPSVLEARARDIALRFGRLQARFGPWGLAWLEAILRAADQQASRDLDERGN